MLAILVIVFFCFADRLTEWYFRNEEYATELVGQGTALFVTMQIIIIMKHNHENVGGSDLPEPYALFIEHFSFITLDAIQFVPFNCVYTEGFDMFDNLLLETLTPISFYLIR